MQGYPEGSRYAISEKQKEQEACGLSSSRRGFLGTLGAAVGLLIAPSHTEILGSLQPLMAPPAGGELVHAAAIEALFGEDWLVCEIYPGEDHLRESFRWKSNQADGNKATRYRIGSVELRFPRTAVCYMAVQCQIDLPSVYENDDADDHPGWFCPQHLLDFPRVTPTYGNHEGGRLWEGLETNAYHTDATALLSRHEAIARVAMENRKLLKNGEYIGICNEADWWVAVQIGAPLEEPQLSIDLKNGIGKADFHTMEFACRVVEPTADEIARYGSPRGESEVSHA